MFWEPIDVSATESLPDEATLTADSAAAKTKIDTFKGHIADMDSAWKGLSGIYEAPAQEQVLAAMNEPKNAAEDLVDSGTSVKKALQDFASTVGDLETKHNTLVSDISDAKALYAGSPSYPGSPGGSVMGDGMVGYRQHAVLVTRAKSLASDYTTAQEKCVADLKAIGRVTTDVTSHYAPGILDLVSNDAERLRRDASEQNSTVAQIRAYYAYLGKMTPKQIKALGEDYPEAAVYGPRKSMPAREQVEFWNGLSPAQQTAMAASLPIIVGNTEGVTYGKRSNANREVLRLVTEKDFPPTKQQKKAFAAIIKSLEAPIPRAPERYLISFDPSTNKPLAGVAIGDLDRATTVTFNTSGIGSDTPGMVGEVKKAQSVFDGQNQYGDSSANAVVAWIGYDSPGMFPESTEVNYTDKAKVGGQELATQLDGLHLTRESSSHGLPHVTVGAHSYGTTMSTYALTRTEFDVDKVFFYGSAGVDPHAASSAEDLHVKRGNDGRPDVYATQALGDMVAPGGIFSSQFGDVARISPTDDAFGAKVLHSEASISEDRQLLRPTRGHGGLGDVEEPRLQVLGSGDLLSYLKDYTGRQFSGIVGTEEGYGYLDKETTSLHDFSQISMDQTSNLNVRDQAYSDTVIEAAQNDLEASLQRPQRLVDLGQLGTNALVDQGQHNVDQLQDLVVDGANKVVDGGQQAANSVVDAGQYAVGSQAKQNVDVFQYLLVGDEKDSVNGGQYVVRSALNGAVDGAQHVVGSAFNGAVNLGQDGLDKGVDFFQGRFTDFVDATGTVRNVFIDDAQGLGNDHVDGVQETASDLSQAVEDKVEDKLRAHSEANRDQPTR